MIQIQLEKLLEDRTLYWLSQQTGVRWATLSDMASGKAKRLDLEALDAICGALECEPGDLLVRIERRKQKRAKPAPKR